MGLDNLISINFTEQEQIAISTALDSIENIISSK